MMNVFKTALSLVAIYLLGAATVYAATSVRVDSDDKVRETQISYVVGYEDGSKDRVVVRYEAFVRAKVWQTGSASSLRKLKIIDDRKCHYSVQARVYRRAYVVTHSGVQAPIEEYQAVYDATQYGKRGADNFFQAIGYHRTCGDVNNFAARIGAAHSQLMAHFEEIVGQDDDKARETLKRLLIGVSIAQVQSSTLAKR